jgi:hypothetical protein
MTSLFEWFHIDVIVGNATVKEWYEKWLLTSMLILFKCQSGRLILYSMWTTMSALWLDINSWYYKLLYILFSKLGVSIALIWPNYPV